MGLRDVVADRVKPLLDSESIAVRRKAENSLNALTKRIISITIIMVKIRLSHLASSRVMSAQEKNLLHRLPSQNSLLSNHLPRNTSPSIMGTSQNNPMVVPKAAWLPTP